MPYIHVTTSAVLPILPFTEFKLCSIRELLFKYKVAPLCGEIECGGLRNAVLDEVATAFARVGDGYWNAGQLKTYGTMKYKPHYSNPEALNEKLDFCLSKNFGNILEIIVKILRDKQMGSFPVLSLEKIQAINLKIHKALAEVEKSFIANYLFIRYFSAPKQAQTSFKESDGIFNYIKDNTKKICNNFLELSSAEQLNFISNNFTSLPEGLIFLKETSPLLDEKKSHVNDHLLNLALTDQSQVLNYISFWFFNDRIKEFNLTPNFEKILATVKLALSELNQAVDFLLKIINSEIPIQDFSQHELFVNDSFPIAFIVDDESVLEPLKNEYRAKRSLQIGSDIKTILTNEHHIDMLKQLSEHYNLHQKIEIKQFGEIDASFGEAFETNLNSFPSSTFRM